MSMRKDDPQGGYNFLITVNGVGDDGQAVTGSFTEISGLEHEVTPRRMPGLSKYTDITCKRGVVRDAGFRKWILAGGQGQQLRADGSIVLLDENRHVVRRWNFHRAWVRKYSGPGLNAAGNEIALETLEIGHEGLEIDSGN